MNFSPNPGLFSTFSIVSQNKVNSKSYFYSYVHCYGLISDFFSKNQKIKSTENRIWNYFFT